MFTPLPMTEDDMLAPIAAYRNGEAIALWAFPHHLYFTISNTEW